MTGAVGLITEPRQANEIVTGGDADLVFHRPRAAPRALLGAEGQHELGEEPTWPTPYGYAVSGGRSETKRGDEIRSRVIPLNLHHVNTAISNDP